MITGVYLPEINGAVLQCNEIVKQLNSEFSFLILCNCSKLSQHGSYLINKNCLINKIYLPNNFILFKTISYFYFYTKLIFLLLFNKIDILHIHGYSVRNAVVILIAKIFQRKIILKMTSFGVDDPMSVKNRGYLYWFFYKKSDVFIGLSPVFTNSYLLAKLDINKYKLIPNFVNIDLFKPVNLECKNIIRKKFGFNSNDIIILFVGHFSDDKNPLLLFESCLKIFDQFPSSKLLFIGSYHNSYEIDNNIYNNILQYSLEKNYIRNVKFINSTYNIDQFYKLSDIFVLTSKREGLPNSLLEAMSSGNICISNSLSGITDWVITNLEDGILFHNSKEELTKLLYDCIVNNYKFNDLKLKARQKIINQFSSSILLPNIVNLYNNN